MRTGEGRQTNHRGIPQGEATSYSPKLSAAQRTEPVSALVRKIEKETARPIARLFPRIRPFLSDSEEMTVCLLTTRGPASPPWLPVSSSTAELADRFGREGVVSPLDSGEEGTVVLLDARISHHPLPGGGRKESAAGSPHTRRGRERAGVRRELTPDRRERGRGQ